MAQDRYYGPPDLFRLLQKRLQLAGRAVYVKRLSNGLTVSHDVLFSIPALVNTELSILAGHL